MAVTSSPSTIRTVTVAPPQWLVAIACVTQVTGIVLFIMYLMGKLECNKYVHTVLWMTLAWWLLMMAWVMGSGVNPSSL